MRKADVIEQAIRELDILASAWSGDWADLDGREVQAQINEITDWMEHPKGELVVGREFYHWHITRQFGYDRCPFPCPFCAGAGEEEEP